MTKIIIVIAIVLAGWWIIRSMVVVPGTTGTTPSTESVATTTEATEQSAEVQSVTVTISGSEFSYEPATISAKVGQVVTVTYKNVGKYPHNFVVDELGVKSQTIKSGQTETIRFTPTKAGTFAFYCSLPTHREKGMVGTLLVQ